MAVSPWADRKEPKRTNCRMDKVLPTCRKLHMLMAEPMRTIERTLREEPTWQNENTDALFPILEEPVALNPEPSRRKERREIELPTCMYLRILVMEPKRAQDRIETSSPSWT